MFADTPTSLGFVHILVITAPEVQHGAQVNCRNEFSEDPDVCNSYCVDHTCTDSECNRFCSRGRGRKPMTINDAIRKANSEHVIYALLTAYVETLQFSRKLPEHLTVLPIGGLHDLQSRFEKLANDLETTIRLPDVSAFDVVQTLSVFDSAINRLSQVQREGGGQGEVRGRLIQHPTLLAAGNPSDIKLSGH